MLQSAIKQLFAFAAMRPFKSVLRLATVIVIVLTVLLPTSAQAQGPVNHPNCDGPACWWYVKAIQTSFTATPVGIQEWLTIERPVVQGGVYGQHHSLAAMYIATFQGNTAVNAVELGWAVAPNIYTDEEPHLFAFVAKDGVQSETCWPHPETCGWVAVPGAKHHLGEYLTPEYGSGVTKPFMIFHNRDGNWWVLYDQEWIGYFAGSYWNGQFTSGNTLAWYGEVETVNEPNGDCTAMGDGKFGTQPGAAHVGGMGYWTWNGTRYTLSWARAVEDLKYGNNKFYNMGNHVATFTSFDYGGPGGYVDEYGNVSTCPTP